MAVYTVSFKQLLDGYAVLQTLTNNEIEVDRSITVAGVGAPFNGTFTVYALPQYEYVGLGGEGDPMYNVDMPVANQVMFAVNAADVDRTAATGTINYDITTQSVLYFTTNASGNFTVNFRGSSGTSLNTLMSDSESMSVTFLVTNGSTAYYNSAVQVDGSSVTPKWQGGTAPTSGNASSIDSYTYVIIKTGSAAFTVLAAQTKFA